jgi:hypothetical protein
VHVQHVLDIRVITLRPHLALVGHRLDEVYFNVHALTLPSGRRFDQVVHPELGGDLGNRHLGVRVPPD